MTVNFSNSLAGLSLLTNTASSFSSVTDVAVESRAVRIAKAQFTTPATTPPWKQAQPSTPVSTQVSEIKRMATIIDKAATGADALPTDVATSFTTYKALDRLRLLAETAAKTTTSAPERALLQTAFGKGLNDLQKFLATAPADKVNLSFGAPTRRAESTKINAPDPWAIKGKTLVKERADAIPGLTGSEKFTITLTKPGVTDTVHVDLSTGPQPPTLDSVATAINAAITAIPLRNPDGTLFVDEQGEGKPRWGARFVVEKGTDAWGLKLDAPSGVERVAITDDGAADSLVVVSGQTALDAPTATRVLRFDDPDGTMAQTTLADIKAVDRNATDRAKLIPPATKTATVKDVARPSSDVAAPVTAAGVVVDSQGYSYVVGTASGELGDLRITGKNDLFLTKLDSQGKTVWQRALGATGAAEGAAIRMAADGSIVVAGSVTGNLDGANTDGDMFVSRFAANGDEKYTTIVRAVGVDKANAVAVGADGAVFVGGRTEAGDAFVARLNDAGKIQERRTLDTGGSESVTAMAIGGDGNPLMLLNVNGVAQVRKLDATAIGTDLATLDLGTADARAIAVGADGTIAVAGATSGALAGSEVNGRSDGRDGFVARIDGDLSEASVTYLASTGDDQVDSVAFLGDSIYVGGRTTGTLGAEKRGPTDGFIARVDAGDGSIVSTTQFGQTALRTEPVRIAAAPKGAGAVSALGFNSGTINPDASAKLTTNTGLRAGDEFSIRVAGGTLRKVTIEADDTLETLAARIRVITGSKATVTTPKMSGGATLRIEAKSGSPVELVAGGEGKDALAKLGIDPQRLTVPAITKTGDPKVKPGGTYGLGLVEGLSLATAADAKAALGKVKDAISTSQTAYRSLYWDSGKQMLVEGTAKKGKGSVHDQAQLASYQAALKRLNTPNPTLGF